jgi:hypothetical protein
MESTEKEKFCWTPCILCGHSVEVFESERAILFVMIVLIMNGVTQNAKNR